MPSSPGLSPFVRGAKPGQEVSSLSPELGEACTRLVELLTGRPRDGQILRQARRLHALIDGLALHLLMQSPSEDSDWAIEILREELARITPGTPA